ncbi:MAG: adenosylcobinamide-phosphate synthase CbiB [Alphaproteobacteria bacterium]|nr:adenosylcobinamide-phosphate synthase CbiB [Alphaproteobacteria bacterium]
MMTLVAAIAFFVERLVGYPGVLQHRIGHPVEWIGRLIGLLDDRLNRADLTHNQRRLNGVLALAIVLLVTGMAATMAQALCRALPLGFVFEAAIASAFLASRHLGRAVQAVADELNLSLSRGQVALQPIVGRDARRLDGHGVSRAAIETLAENTSDGVVAPLLFLALFGLPGIALYKAINTADSMIGHLTARHADFGWAAAKLDDVANFVPARLTALLIAAAAYAERVRDNWLRAFPTGRSTTRTAANGRAAWDTAKRDAPKQDSPNSGWPEAAMAGALGLRLGGPRAYGGVLVDLPFMGTGRAEAVPDDIERALRLYGRVNDLALAAIIALALLVAGTGLY